MFLISYDSFANSFVGITKTLDAAAVLVEDHFKKEFEHGYTLDRFTLKNGKIEKTGDLVEINIDVVYKFQPEKRYTGYIISEVKPFVSRKKNHDFTAIWDICKRSMGD